METRRRLLDSALDVMSEKPFSSVSMNDIAEGVGMSKGAVYWHFKNKNDVLTSLLETICDEAKRDFYQVVARSDGYSGLRFFFKQKMLVCIGSERARKTHKLIHRMHEWPDDVARGLHDSLRNMLTRELEMITELVRKAQERRLVRDDLPAGDIAGLMCAIFSGMIFLQTHELCEMDLVKYSDFIFSVLDREFSCDGGTLAGEILNSNNAKEMVCNGIDT
jgi:TetR/AcrR family acrAB operon transcriptional repressor